MVCFIFFSWIIFAMLNIQLAIVWAIKVWNASMLPLSYTSSILSRVAPKRVLSENGVGRAPISKSRKNMPKVLDLRIYGNRGRSLRLRQWIAPSTNWKKVCLEALLAWSWKGESRPFHGKFSCCRCKRYSARNTKIGPPGVCANFPVQLDDYPVYRSNASLRQEYQEFWNNNIALTEDGIIKLASETIKQSESEEWFRSRRLRLSASPSVHKVKSRSRKSVDSLKKGSVDQLTEYVPQNENHRFYHQALDSTNSHQDCNVNKQHTFE